VICTYVVIGRKLVDRFGKLITNCEFSIAVRNEEDRETLAAIAREIQALDDGGARASITGLAA
jgi:hypothetical protein